jgi:hypothetical protein
MRTLTERPMCIRGRISQHNTINIYINEKCCRQEICRRIKNVFCVKWAYMIPMVLWFLRF